MHQEGEATEEKPALHQALEEMLVRKEVENFKRLSAFMFFILMLGMTITLLLILFCLDI